MAREGGGALAHRSLSYRLHDALNVPLVGALSLMCIGGLLGALDTVLITKIFIAYIVVDTLWILIFPSGGDSGPSSHFVSSVRPHR